jgi:hypothetical protein
VTSKEHEGARVDGTCEIGVHAMTRKQSKISLKDVVICAAFIWAYQEYAKSQRLRDTLLPLDELTDHLWEQLKLLEKADIPLSGYKKLFHFLFEQEFKTFSSLVENERIDVIEKTEVFFKNIGYRPTIKIKRE